MLSISGGKWRGRKFAPQVGQATRPTAIRAREGLFNVIEHRYGSFHGKRVADLFAGTGALGLEAMSRGAEHCLFVDQDAVAMRNLKSILTSLKAQTTTEVQTGKAEQLNAPIQSLDMVFLDPPYGADLLQPAIRNLVQRNALASGALIIAELDKKEQGPDVSTLDLRLDQDRNWGRNRFQIFTLS